MLWHGYLRVVCGLCAIVSGLGWPASSRAQSAKPPADLRQANDVEDPRLTDGTTERDNRTRSGADEPSFSGLTVQLDEDFFQTIGPTSDRNYTMGVGASASGHWVREAYLDRPTVWLDRLTGVQRLRNWLDVSGRHDSHTLSLRMAGFTPQAIESPAPVHGDRPYASILALSSAIATANEEVGVALVSDFAVGLLGVHSAADWIQSSIHDLVRDPKTGKPYKPGGWRHQISDSATGEPTVRYAVTYWKRLSPSVGPCAWIDLAALHEVGVGWYTGLASGLQLRIGHLNSAPWQTMANPLNSVNQRAGLPAPGNQRKPLFEAYGYARGVARLVGYNALLHGQFGDKVVAVGLADISPVVSELELGASLRISVIRIHYAALSLRTPEYHIRGTESRSHSWGGVYIGYERQ